MPSQFYLICLTCTVHLLFISDAFGNLAGAWVAGSLDTDQYLQVDMKKSYRFKKVHIQGRADADEWVTSFMIWYDPGNYTWVLYNDTDGNNVSTYTLFVFHEI